MFSRHSIPSLVVASLLAGGLPPGPAIGQSVAIVQNFPDGEISLMQVYLAELGMTSTLYDQGSTDDMLAMHDLVIWNDLGQQGSGLGNDDVYQFDRLFDAGIPMYFIGDDLAYSHINLNPQPSAYWTALSHLGPANNIGGGDVVVVAPAHPVIAGPFGTVRAFAYYGDIDAAVASQTGETVLAVSGGGWDAILAFESACHRSVTQNCRLTGAPQSSEPMRKILFQNAVTWLVSGGSAGCMSEPEGVTFHTDLADWNAAAGSTTLLRTTAANVAMANEVPVPPGNNQFLSGVLTFPAAATGLPNGFRLTALQPGVGFTYNDNEGGVDQSDALSVGDVDNGENDDVSIDIISGPPVHAVGMMLGGNFTAPGEEAFRVFCAGGCTQGVSVDIPGPGGNASAFIGVVTQLPIIRVEFDEDAGGDDISVADFRFGSACPADLNGDGHINGADLAILLANWGPCNGALPTCTVADLTDDGLVDPADLSVLLGAWGDCQSGR
ncbi:MAG: hypothetical protein KDA25_08170 [Phycisphaerales bacterium]|nr:hypothetical protein [Phycisphaerales bacterium]